MVDARCGPIPICPEPRLHVMLRFKRYILG